MSKRLTCYTVTPVNPFEAAPFIYLFTERTNFGGTMSKWLLGHLTRNQTTRRCSSSASDKACKQNVTRPELFGKLRSNNIVLSCLLNAGSNNEEVTSAGRVFTHGPRPRERRGHWLWTDVSRGPWVRTSMTNAGDAWSWGPPLSFKRRVVCQWQLNVWFWCAAGTIRSNNDVEGWHQSLNAKASKGNLNLYLPRLRNDLYCVKWDVKP